MLTSSSSTEHDHFARRWFGATPEARVLTRAFLRISLEQCVSRTRDRDITGLDWVALHALSVLLQINAKHWDKMRRFRVATAIHMLFHRVDQEKSGTRTLGRVYFPRDRKAQAHLDSCVVWAVSNFAKQIREIYSPFLFRRWRDDLIGIGILEVSK